MRSSSPLLIQSSRSSDLDLNLKAHFTSPCFPWARFRRFQTAISGAEDGRRVNDVSQSLCALTPHSALWLRGEHVKHYLSNQHAGNNLVELVLSVETCSSGTCTYCASQERTRSEDVFSIPGAEDNSSIVSSSGGHTWGHSSMQ